MSYRSVESGLVARVLTLLAVKIRTHRYLRRLWKPSVGLPTFLRFCIKVQPFEDLAEASAMKFVAEHTKIPVPKVYCAFVRKGKTYLLMSKIDGQQVYHKWVQRSAASKELILHQIHHMVHELRSIAPPPGTCVANVNGGPIRDCRLPGSMPSGPFSTIRQFHEALANGASFDTKYEELPPDLENLFSFYRRMPETPVFTHGDLSSLNILVRGDTVVGIVDWETAGWFPPYWESTCAWNVNPYNTFWQDEVDKFIPTTTEELKMDTIRRKYFGST